MPSCSAIPAWVSPCSRLNRLSLGPAKTFLPLPPAPAAPPAPEPEPPPDLVVTPVVDLAAILTFLFTKFTHLQTSTTQVSTRSPECFQRVLDRAAHLVNCVRHPAGQPGRPVRPQPDPTENSRWTPWTHGPPAGKPTPRRTPRPQGPRVGFGTEIEKHRDHLVQEFVDILAVSTAPPHQSGTGLAEDKFTPARCLTNVTGQRQNAERRNFV